MDVLIISLHFADEIVEEMRLGCVITDTDDYLEGCVELGFCVFLNSRARETRLAYELPAPE